jgi:membrane-bound lytic murein transglycosylase MltF
MRIEMAKFPYVSIAAIVSFLLAAAACGGSEGPQAGGGAAEAPQGEVLSRLDDLPVELERVVGAWTGDLDGMVERRMVRFLTAYNPMFYSLDGAEQGGVVYESAARFEEFLNKRLRRKRLPVHVVIVPVRRDRILTALREGRGDVAAGNLTVTPDRLAMVEFTEPLMRDVSEIVVTGPATGRIDSIDDLAGRTLRLRRTSSYWASVQGLNEGFRRIGRPPVVLEQAEPFLEDHDLLEMVHAGMLELAVVDSHKAELWARVFDGLQPRPDLAIRRGGQIAWAFRRGSPQLREVLDEFVRKHREGTLFGNVVYNRYLKDATWVRNALDAGGRDRFRELAELFRQYGERYGIDWVLVAAQAYQESGLDPSRRSRAGAVGVMQLRETAAEEVGIRDISDLENNVHAGVKYLRHLIDEYFDDPGLDPFDRQVFALAAYNAGPTRIRRLRREAESKGLDPNVWFDNVEVIVARRVGREPVRYVGNILKYYVAYKLALEKTGQRP